MQRTVTAVLGAALLSVSAAAQSPAPAAPATPAGSAVPVEAPADAVKPAGTAPAPDTTSAQGFTYTAEGRRDPFVPLLRGSGTAVLATTEKVRAAGLAGLETAEVTLRGVLMSQGGYVAMVKGNDKTYIVRAGDRLADGTIRTITSRMLVIAQQVKDPLSRTTEREVHKMLRQQADGTN